eukprot:TRINITY_DN62_c0_g1_i2.p1 TRINITY_DN62_c0_g1~~TRINITY_DN62_c0_g1_i2.p1  ORF type:complete len:1720 (-),score=288.39 TRINITY_DN62_c0_g1_i2:470-5599(-)
MHAIPFPKSAAHTLVRAVPCPKFLFLLFVYLTSATPPVVWTFGPHTYSVNEGSGVAYPSDVEGYADRGGWSMGQGVSADQCAIACLAATGCDSFIHSDYGECYLKSGASCATVADGTRTTYWLGNECFRTHTATATPTPPAALALHHCPNNCSGHGSCHPTTSGPACECESKTGHWDGADCSECLSVPWETIGWMGPQCATECPKCHLPGVVSTTLPDGLLERTMARFPERQKVNPQYVNWTNPNLHFLTEGRMNVTFLYEGAGYHNTFGYYTFNPVTTEVIDQVVLFPDATMDAKDCLHPGDSVQQIGPFAAGTHVGFYIQSNGWCNNHRQSGDFCLRSIEALNSDGMRHLALYQDLESGVLVLGFEDIVGLTDDNDYNDVMFFASISGSVAQLTTPAVDSDPCRSFVCPQRNQRCEVGYERINSTAFGLVATCVTNTPTPTADATATPDATPTRSESESVTPTSAATVTQTTTPQPLCAASYTRGQLGGSGSGSGNGAVLTLNFARTTTTPAAAGGVSFAASTGALFQFDASLASGSAVVLAGPFTSSSGAMTVRLDALWEVNRTSGSTPTPSVTLSLRSATVLCVASVAGAVDGCQIGKRYSLQSTTEAVLQREPVTLVAGFAVWDEQTPPTASQVEQPTGRPWVPPLSDQSATNTTTSTTRCRDPASPLQVTDQQCEAPGCPVCMPGWLSQTSSASDQLVRRVLDEFPERQDVNASFIQWANPNLHFLTEGNLSVTFVHEGASYHNSMGYFVYDPVTLAVLSEVVLFPDVSLEPGCLQRGAAALDVGPFPAGTHVGFFINSNGWCPPASGSGSGNGSAASHKLYSVDQLNTDGYRHLAVFHDTVLGAYVLGFEDVWGITDDRDYNDVMFTVVITGTVDGLDVVPSPIGTASLVVAQVTTGGTAPLETVCCDDRSAERLAARDYGCCGVDLAKACSPFASCTRRSGGRADCACLPGFQGNGSVCVDIDECATGTARCHTLAVCTNSVGGYECSCNAAAGLKGDGFTSCVPASNCTTSVTPSRRQLGGDLRDHPATSAGDCAELCRLDPECVAATFSLGLARCWLHSVLLGTVAVEGEDWSYATKDCGSCTMSVSGSSEQVGAVLAYHSGTTRSACAAACLGTAGCVAATHDAGTATTATTAAAGDCFLHYALLPAVFSLGKSLLVRACPNDNTPTAGTGTGSNTGPCQAVQFPGRRQVGADLTEASASTADECATLCLATGSCVAASFVSGQCWMHSQMLSTSADSSWTYVARQCGGCGYVRGSGFREIGKDLANYAASSEEECESRCTGVVGCAAVTFSRVLQRCWLHSGLALPVPDGAFHLSVKRCASGCTTQSYPATRMLGSDLTHGPAPTVADCAQLCLTTANCAAASFNLLTLTCWLHANLTAAQSGVDDWVLAVLDCGGASLASSSSSGGGGGSNNNNNGGGSTTLAVSGVLRVEATSAPPASGVVSTLANWTGIPLQQVSVTYTIEVGTSSSRTRFAAADLQASSSTSSPTRSYDVGVSFSGLDGVNATAVQTKLKLAATSDSLGGLGVRAISSVAANFTSDGTAVAQSPSATTTTNGKSDAGSSSTSKGKVVAPVVAAVVGVVLLAVVGAVCWRRRNAHLAHQRHENSGSDKEGAPQDKMHLDGIKVVDDAGDLSEEEATSRRATHNASPTVYSFIGPNRSGASVANSGSLQAVSGGKCGKTPFPTPFAGSVRGPNAV